MISGIDPALIRETAIRLVRKHPDGIRQIDLIGAVMDELNIQNTLDAFRKVKNTVWNLDTKSDEVIKKKLGHREVLYLPITAAVQVIEDKGYYQIRMKPRMALSFLLNHLDGTLENNEYYVNRIFDLDAGDFANLEPEELNAIFEVRHAINAINRARRLISSERE